MNDFNNILNDIDIDDILKYNLINFISINGFKIDIININNNILNDYLNLIADYKNIILSYDIEFYNQLINHDDKTYYYYHKQKIQYLINYSIIKTIREIGGILFIRSKYNNNWYFIGSFNIKLNLYFNDLNNLQPIYTNYADVSLETKNKMILIEKQIFLYNKYKTELDNNDIDLEFIINNKDKILEYKNIIIKLINNIINDDDFKYFLKKPKYINILTNINNYYSDNINNIILNLEKLFKDLNNIKFYFFGNLTSNYTKELVLNLNKLYLDDNKTNNNFIEPLNLDSFIYIFNKSKNIGKEYTDIEAIFNTCYIYKLNLPDTYKYFDISFFNQISRLYCGSAKLENSYLCILDLLNFNDIKLNDNKTINNLIDMKKAHNPEVDAIMTLIISIYIIKTLYKNHKNN